MRIRILYIIIIALVLPCSMQAQKKKKVARRPVAAAKPEPVEDPRLAEMRELTQQIVFIDSVVVEKGQLLSAIRLTQESGSLSTYDQFFKAQSNPDWYLFLNELANKCYYAQEDAQGRQQLFTSDKLGGEWSNPMSLRGIDESYVAPNYPFMMADGITFYFAAQGEESIGGYDIFATRYDSENGQFLKPENIGMPFNSEANDYMYAIDEPNNIGFFVTDRRQAADKVCVYIFIPPKTRLTYGTDKYSESQLRGLADISCIADTWVDKKEREQAMKRLKLMESSQQLQKRPEIEFVINDKTTYTSLSQFHSQESRNLYKKLSEAEKKSADIQAYLEKSRTYYGKAFEEDKKALQSEIIEAEKQLEQLSASIKSLRKRIRNTEIKSLNQ